MGLSLHPPNAKNGFNSAERASGGGALLSKEIRSNLCHTHTRYSRYLYAIDEALVLYEIHVRGEGDVVHLALPLPNLSPTASEHTPPSSTSQNGEALVVPDLGVTQDNN